MNRLRERWEQSGAGGPNIFQSFAWMQLAAMMFAASEKPLVVASESDSGMALIPAAVTAGGTTLSLIGETLFDYRNVLHRGDESVLKRAWSEVAKLRLPLRFTALKGDEKGRTWEGFELEPFAAAPAVLRAHTTAEQFREAHPRLGRQVRRLAKRGAMLRRYDGSSSGLIEWVYKRKAEQPHGGIFADPLRREFMVRVAEGDPAACDVFTYETQTEVVAALVTFRHGSTRHFYTIYFDQAWAQLSPGQVLVYEVTALSLAEGLDCDYMTGEQPYKMRLATTTVPLYTVKASAERLYEISSGSGSRVEVAA